MLDDLRDYLNLLDEKGLLHKVEVEVDPVEEVPEVLRRLMWRRFDKAVLFERLKGYPDWRVAGNLFGSMDLIKLALGRERLEEIGEKLVAPFKASGRRSFGDKVKTLMEFINIGKYLPKKVRKGPVLENEKDPDFFSLPAFKTWPKDASRYLTYALTVTKDPESGVHNFGVYRIMLYSPKRAVIHWQIHKRGASHYTKYKELGYEKMPVAVVIGGDPATLLTGALPVPEGIDKYAFAGVLRSSPVKVVEAGELLVPAFAEVVITGHVRIGELAWEGPFGDHTGYYTPRGLYPVFRAERFFVRSNPIYYGTVVGRPPMEDSYIGKATERIFLPLIKWLVPEVVDVNLPPEGLFHGIAIVSIRKKYPGHARKVAHALLGLGQMSFTKIIIVVDHDVNVHDWGEVAYAVASTVDPERDVEIVSNDVTDVLDHTSPNPPVGSKMIVDATRKLREECGYEWPERSSSDPKVSKLVERRWHEYGF